ncbi:MAG: hypothetical protein ACI3YB_06820, partial [Prevotella sp.]
MSTTNSEKASYECTLYIDTRLFREKATSGNIPKNINDKIVKKRPYMGSVSLSVSEASSLKPVDL